MNQFPSRPNDGPKGRGSALRPANRFESVRLDDDWEQLDDAAIDETTGRSIPTEYFPDESKSIVSENDSPDIGFRFSVNPYRGCQHGCSYCYARPTHEYLGMNAGVDFESKIMVKHRAAELFRDWLANRREEAETVVMSGVTDCYQPAERQFQITRGCLQVALEARQPIGVITKNALVVRDVDLLEEMARLNLVRVMISITTLDADLARRMEPRTSAPHARLRAVERLRAAGVSVGVMAAPIIPALNDVEIPAILRAAAEAGAQGASYTLLRLPLTVRPVFLEWLERCEPLAKERVTSRILDVRGGKLNQSQFGRRMRGEGEIAEQIRRTFEVFAKRYRLDGKLPPLETSLFKPPRASSGQLRMF